MRVMLITLDSVRHDTIPQWFIEKRKPSAFTNMYTPYAGTIPSLTSFYTGLMPALHGIGDHHIFFKFHLNCKTLFDILKEHDITTIFSSDEWLMYKMQVVEEAIHLTDLEEVMKAVQDDNVFAAIHFFKLTHSPYRSQEVRDIIGKKKQLAWFDPEFIKLARTEQMKQINANFQIIDNMLDDFDGKVIISSDHGEAFGEQGVYGHDRLNMEEVLHVPYMMIDGEEPKSYTNHAYVTVTYDIVLKWFGIEERKRNLHQLKIYVPPYIKGMDDLAQMKAEGQQ